MNKVYNKKYKETIYTHTLDNGLKIIMVPKKDYHQVSAFFTAKFGGCYYGIDVNGIKPPNRLGRDRFEINLLSQEFLEAHPSAKPVDTYYTQYENKGKNVTSVPRSERLSSCKSSGWTCFGLIMNDGWEIKDDYPYSI